MEPAGECSDDCSEQGPVVIVEGGGFDLTAYPHGGEPGQRLVFRSAGPEGVERAGWVQMDGSRVSSSPPSDTICRSAPLDATNGAGCRRGVRNLTSFSTSGVCPGERGCRRWRGVVC